MNSNMSPSPSPPLHHLLTFMIAFIAGIAAAILPRLLTGISNTNLSEEIVLFPMSYIFMSLAFASIVAAISTILMWNSSFDPPKIFMTTLGIPALISGSFNTVDSVWELDQKLRENNVIQEKIADQIQEEGGESLLIVPAEKIDRSSPPVSSINQGAGVFEKTSDLDLFRPAYAQGPSSNSGTPIDSWLGGIVKEPQYNVGISNLFSEEEAKELQKQLNSGFEIFPSRDGNSFFLLNVAEMSKLLATIQALSLQKKIGLISKESDTPPTEGKTSNDPRVIITPVIP